MSQITDRIANVSVKLICRWVVLICYLQETLYYLDGRNWFNPFVGETKRHATDAISLQTTNGLLCIYGSLLLFLELARLVGRVHAGHAYDNFGQLTSFISMIGFAVNLRQFLDFSRPGFFTNSVQAEGGEGKLCSRSDEPFNAWNDPCIPAFNPTSGVFHPMFRMGEGMDLIHMFLMPKMENGIDNNVMDLYHEHLEFQMDSVYHDLSAICAHDGRLMGPGCNGICNQCFGANSANRDEHYVSRNNPDQTHTFADDCGASALDMCFDARASALYNRLEAYENVEAADAPGADDIMYTGVRKVIFITIFYNIICCLNPDVEGMDKVQLKFYRYFVLLLIRNYIQATIGTKYVAFFWLTYFHNLLEGLNGCIYWLGDFSANRADAFLLPHVRQQMDLLWLGLLDNVDNQEGDMRAHRCPLAMTLHGILYVSMITSLVHMTVWGPEENALTLNCAFLIQAVALLALTSNNSNHDCLMQAAGVADASKNNEVLDDLSEMETSLDDASDTATSVLS